MVKEPVALVSGCLGQDGRLITALLLSKGYKVVGISSRDKHPSQILRNKENGNFTFIKCDIRDSEKIFKILEEYKPFEFYHFGGISSVAESFRNPLLTMNVNAIATSRILQAISASKMVDQLKFYHASSSEQFGTSEEMSQTEDSLFRPNSPYAESKVLGHLSTKYLREYCGLKGWCGIAYNHESTLRDYKFVTRKISREVARIKLGKSNKLALGDTTIKRDWGHARDYVYAAWLMLQSDNPTDYIIATNTSHSLMEFVQEAFSVVGIADGYSRYVQRDPSFVRPKEPSNLRGDHTKITNALGWKPTIEFQEIVREMVEHDLRIESNGA